MADISVSVPHGGGQIRSESDSRSSSGYVAMAYCWLGGTSTTGPDNNLFISVRLQQDPDFAIVDLWTQNIRSTTHGRSGKRSRIYGLGGNAMSLNTNNLHERSINMERINSTTALLKVPYDSQQSTYYVLEVDESTYDCGIYTFDDGKNGGLYNYSGPNHSQSYVQQDMFMQRVEDNVVVCNDQYSTSNSFLTQRVWDPTAKTLTATRICSSQGSQNDINNFNSNQGQIRVPTYGQNSGSPSQFSLQWSVSGSSPRYITSSQGRDGKWYFRVTNTGSSAFSSIYNAHAWAITYIPTSMGGDLATSNWSQSWGITGGFKSAQYGNLTNNTGRFGGFLPIDVEDNATTKTSPMYNYPSFYMKSYIEVGAYSMIVHVDGTQNTEMNYHSSVSGNTNWGFKQALWLDSNHFFVHGTSNYASYWSNQGYDRWFVNQYVDESYTNNEGYGTFTGNQSFNNRASNGSAQWTKIDDYTLTCQGFNGIKQIWAPE